MRGAARLHPPDCSRFPIRTCARRAFAVPARAIGNWSGRADCSSADLASLPTGYRLDRLRDSPWARPGGCGRHPLPRLDPRRLRYGIKVALSVLITLFGWTMLQWPFGESAVLTAFVVTQGSIGSSNRKAMLRLAGTRVPLP